MQIHSSSKRYGSVSKALHWLSALLILTAMPIGLIASNMPVGTEADIAKAFWTFSLHKTVGITAFFVVILRIIWASIQPKPTSLQPHGWETAMADGIHWLLYLSMAMVPLSGWLHHAALDGFAPIWWPFDQSLPFVPKSDAIAYFFGAWHFVFTKVLAISILLHVAGALKHHFLDRDSTLRRMLPGNPHLPDLKPETGGRFGLFAAVIVYVLALGGGSALGLQGKNGLESERLAAIESDWTVESGSLRIQFKQFGGEVSGTFSDWNASIQFDEASQQGKATVNVNISSLDIGSLSQNALEAEYFDVAQFPTAIFQAAIKPSGQSMVADGFLTLRGIKLPLILPFELVIVDGLASARGAVETDRRAYKIGQTQTNEENLGFNVSIEMDLTARKGN